MRCTGTFLTALMFLSSGAFAGNNYLFFRCTGEIEKGYSFISHQFYSRIIQFNMDDSANYLGSLAESKHKLQFAGFLQSEYSEYSFDVDSCHARIFSNESMAVDGMTTQKKQMWERGAKYISAEWRPKLAAL